MNSQDFTTQADQLVAEFLDFLRGDEETHLNADPVRDCKLYDRNEFAKLHRRVWLQWARAKKAAGDEVPEGWLTEFEKQNKDHQEVQRLQADTMFALGYQAALEDMKGQSPESRAKAKAVQPSKRSTVQAFTAPESRMLIASFMAFVSFNLKRKNIAIEKSVVERILKKLEVLADINLDHIEYLPLQTADAASRGKPKWKKHKKPHRNNGQSKPNRGRTGLSHVVNRKAKS